MIMFWTVSAAGVGLKRARPIFIITGVIPTCHLISTPSKVVDHVPEAGIFTHDA